MPALVCAVAVWAIGDALAQDWPQWRGPNRDGKATGCTVPLTWPKELTPRWKVSVGLGDATPALVGKKLFVFARQGSNEVTLCLDAGTGRELWRDRYAAPGVTGPDAGHSGPRSSPAVEKGRIVILGVCGTVSCLDADSGKLIWRKDDFPGAWPAFHTAMSPLIVDGQVVAHLGREDRGALVAYDLSSGEQKWAWAGEGPAYASPVVLVAEGRKMIVTEAAGSIVGIDASDGKQLWRSPLASQSMAYHAATPIVAGQTVIFCGAPGRATKAVKIEKRGDSFGVRELWSNADNPVAFNSPVLKDGLLFGLSQRGKYFCIDARTGHTAWVETTGGRGDFGAIVDAGSVLLGLTAPSQLAVFAPSARAYVELARFKVADQQTYAHPVLAGNRLFIRDQSSVTLWTIE